MDYIIIGCGISGLNIGLKLINKYPTKNIVIYDKSNYVGGRLYTQTHNINNKIIQYEAGGARFNKSHKLLFKLIRNYNLNHKLVKIPNTINTVFSRKIVSKYFNSSQEIIDALLSLKLSKKYLMSKTIYEIVTELYDKETALFLQHSYPYYTVISFTNAYDALRAFSSDLDSSSQYYVLGGGISQLIDKMKNDFIKKGGIIKLNHSLDNVKMYKNGFECFFSNKHSKNTEIQCEHLILACDSYSLQKMTFLKKLNIDLNSVKVLPLLRTYAIYNNSWFEDLGKIVTNESIKYIIPINPKIGLIMISYTDWKNANFWNKLNKTQQKKELTNQLRKLFPDRNIEQPKYIFNHYWKQGVSYWKPNYNSDILTKKIMKPSHYNLYICGDSYSTKQAWMEGALESSTKLFKLYF